VTNNGLSDHIGAAQVQPYVAGLAARGHRMRIVSVEQPGPWPETRDRLEAEAAGTGLTFHPIFRLPGAAGRLQRLAMPELLRRRLARLVGEARPDLIHCRSYMPLHAALRVSARAGLPMVFDMRGFWLDQRIEGGAWNQANPAMRLMIDRFRRLEARAYGEADRIVVLNDAAQGVVAAHPAWRGAPISVVPCSVDQTRFAFRPAARAALREELGIGPDTWLLAYLGSASGVYRIDMVYRIFDALRRAGAPVRLMLLGTHRAEDHIRDAAGLGLMLEPDELICRRLPHDRVPEALSAADAGLAFYIDRPSSLGVSPTKVGEYLACGLPVLTGRGAGDIERIVEDGVNGFVLRDDGPEGIDAMVRALLAHGRFDRDAVKAGRAEHFSLERAVDTYAGIYADLRAGPKP